MGHEKRPNFVSGQQNWAHSGPFSLSWGQFQWLQVDPRGELPIRSLVTSTWWEHHFSHKSMYNPCKSMKKKTMFHVSPHSSPCLMFESHLNPHVSLGNNHSQDITATPRAPKKRTLASHFRHGPAIWLWSPANCRKLPSGGLTEMWKNIGSTRNDLWMVILPHLQLAKLVCRLTTIHLIVYSWVHESTYITQASVVVPQNEDLKNRCRGPTLLDNEPTGRRISIACGDWGLTQAAFFSVFLRKHFLEIRPWVNILKMANL